jgi:hypothetical protein
MKAICKTDYGQFEFNKVYKYSYSYENNYKTYYVIGQYSDTQFTKRQFDAIFISEKPENKNKSFNY